MDKFTKEKAEFKEKYPTHSEIWPDHPGMEFEGPLGYSYSCKDVPDASLLEALYEIADELKNRNFNVKDLIAFRKNLKGHLA